MKNLLSVLVILLTLPILSFAQKDARIATGLKAISEVPQMVMPALNNEALYEAELNRRAPGIAPRFAETMEVQVSTSTHGVWETADNGNQVWRYRVHSAGAKSLNFGFSKFIMPEGGTLILYAANKNKVMGPFTPADNEEHEELWTPVIDSDDVIIEVQLPAEVQSELQLELKSVNHDYIGFSQMSAVSGSCNLDVICGAADGWEIVDGYRDIIRSVAVIGTGGGTFCTGFLVNNVNNDCTPFFMTANHCGINSGNAASLVAYWNFENSTCRQPGSSQSGGNGNGQLNDFNTGAIHRASYAASDVTLVELDDPISPSSNAYFAGWTAEYVMPQDTIIAIHHPSTDEKRISFEFDPSLPGLGLANNVVDISQADHIIIPDWDIGTTEPGSSGSPIYNNQKQVVGQLHGGGAACGNDLYDTYGWFNTSWYGGGTPATALRFWLDPNDTGILNIGGKDCNFSVSVDPPFQELCAPSDANFNLQVAENFAADVTLSANNVPAGATVSFAPNPVPPNGTAVMTVTNTGAVTSGQYQIEINGTDGFESTTSLVTLGILEGAPTMINQQLPANGETGTITSPMFTWTPSAGGGAYDIELATDDAFTNIVESASGLTAANYNSGFLSTLTTYYWRVRGNNICGEGPWSMTWSFTTADIACGNIPSVDVPINIGGGPPNTVTSTLDITATGLIIDINLINLEIDHSYVGDLSATLESPSGTIIQLFDEPEGGSCGESNLSVGFDDSATNTAGDFVATCDGGGTAIAGLFQSADPLSAFNGEDPNGTWTLTVVDDAGQDGGAITGWDIEICTSVPVDIALSPSSTQIFGCLNEDFSLELTVGSDFEMSGVGLSATGNPAGSTVVFSSNPTQPGSTVSVDITGVNTTGTFPLTFTADDGTNLTNAMVSLVVEDTPSAAALSSPANAAVDVSLIPTLQWNAATNVNSYFVELATDAAFANVIASTNTTLLNFPISGGLEYGTEYFWRATSEGTCGSTVSPVNSFTTLLDLTVNVDPNGMTLCANEDLVYEIAVGEGFVSPVSISFNISGGVDVSVASYNVDPADVPPGGLVNATMDLSNATAGTYDVEFTIADASNSITGNTSLVIAPLPDPAALITPVDAANNQSVNLVLNWSAATNAAAYQIDIATDLAFTNIVETQTTAATTYTVVAPLDYLTTYFWRVIAENDCGETQTTTYSFTTEMDVAVDELEGSAFSIMPNPTKGLVNVVFAQALNKDLKVEVYAIDGKLLQQNSYDGMIEQLPIDLSSYSSGVYVVRLVTAKAAVARRVTLQR